MTVNWKNPEDVQVLLTMDKGFKTVYSKNQLPTDVFVFSYVGFPHLFVSYSPLM